MRALVTVCHVFWFLVGTLENEQTQFCLSPLNACIINVLPNTNVATEDEIYFHQKCWIFLVDIWSNWSRNRAKLSKKSTADGTCIDSILFRCAEKNTHGLRLGPNE